MYICNTWVMFILTLAFVTEHFLASESIKRTYITKNQETSLNPLH